ncbi:hypothetical protein CEP52_017718 [Fusarium oligoseptatum]|uniref:Uncharacterized protein n=1 Tax=Fusarium oligoseptatum TaxID=2604345 RepID=A0A428RIS6_9HYPO|nr:hypothetical protein CEP52_017718 [Fusarium oligoseptatum]
MKEGWLKLRVVADTVCRIAAEGNWMTLLKKVEQMPQVHGVTLKDCWLFALSRRGATYDYELGAVYIRNRQDFKEAIAMVEELEMIWNLD